MGLFGFGKKKDAEPKAAKAAERALDREGVLAKVAELRATLEDVEGDARADLLNEVGKLLASVEDVDGAIAAYEESLEVKRVMGKASSGLVKLYNKKRAEAATNKDDAAIKFYLDKVNEMLALSKDQLRGRA